MSRQTRIGLSFLLLTFCIVVAVPRLAAQYGVGRESVGTMRTLQGDNGRDSGRAVDRTPDRRQQTQDVMQESARQLDETLVEVLEMVNRGEKPTPEQLENCKAAYEAARRYAPQFNDALKCEAYMLWAWTEYFSKDLEQAFRFAKTACEADRDNQDAGATQVAMSVLLGRVPLKIEPRPLQAQTQTQTRSRPSPVRSRPNPSAARQDDRPGQINVNASSGNILQLDVDAIDRSLIGKPVGPMKLSCINGSTLDYNPAQSNLCMLFWQLDPKDVDVPAEPNMPGQAARQPLRRPAPQGNVDPGYRGRPDPRRGGAYEDPRRRDDYGAYDRGPASYDAYGYSPGRVGGQGDLLGLETAAYGRLFGSYFANPQVTFVAVNTDSPANARAVVDKLLESPWPWANVMAAAPGGVAQFADLSAVRPTLAIASGGKIMYAGPADGFLAPMVLAHLAGDPAAAGNLAVPANMAAPANNLLNPLMNLLGGAAPTPPAPPAVRPSQQQAAPQPKVNQSGGEDELTPESYEAEKKLTYARQLFIPAGRKNFLTSKRGVDLCREIIRDYPNTKYAQEARLLLRQVPENERRRYNVTDEEMGL